MKAFISAYFSIEDTKAQIALIKSDILLKQTGIKTLLPHQKVVILAHAGIQ